MRKKSIDVKSSDDTTLKYMMENHRTTTILAKKIKEDRVLIGASIIKSVFPLISFVK